MKWRSGRCAQTVPSFELLETRRLLSAAAAHVVQLRGEISAGRADSAPLHADSIAYAWGTKAPSMTVAAAVKNQTKPVKTKAHVKAQGAKAIAAAKRNAAQALRKKAAKTSNVAATGSALAKPTRLPQVPGAKFTPDPNLTPKFRPLSQPIGRPLPPIPYQNDSDGALKQLLTQDDLKKWVIDSAVKQYAGLFGRTVPIPWYYGTWRAGGIEDAAFVTGTTATFSALTNASAGATTYSTTNTQVAGVDEADLVETDGTYIYAVSGGDVVITAAMPAAGMHVVARQRIEGQIRGMYLYNGRLAVVSSVWGWQAAADAAVSVPADNGPHVQLTVFDVSKPDHPTLLETSAMDGSLVTSRAVDGRVYVVVSDNLHAPEPQKIDAPATEAPPPQPVEKPGDTVVGWLWHPLVDSGNKVYESEESYRARLEETWQTLLPQYHVKDGGNVSSGALMAAPDAYVQDADGSAPLTSVGLFDMNDAAAGPIATTTLEGQFQTSYASTSNLYLVKQVWGSAMHSDIFKLALGADHVPLVAQGGVDGTVVDQFSMDDRDGYFRIATTKQDQANNWRQTNSIQVLQQDGTNLKIVGGLTDLAVGERIYSVRFMDKSAYVVTFRQVDPFWTIDFSDPVAPKVAGELQIPGFSKYLQPIGSHYVMGIGVGPGSSGWGFQLQVSLFDVKDPANPARVGVYGFDATESDFDWDHHAVNYFPEQGVIALPVPVTRWGERGLKLLKVADDGSLSDAGFVQQNGGVSRSVLIDTKLFSVGPYTIKAQDISDPGTEISEVKIASEPAPPPPAPPWIWPGGGAVGLPVLLQWQPIVLQPMPVLAIDRLIAD